MLRNPQTAGALVISLDFELYWGVRDRRPLEKEERQRLLSARAAVLRIVELIGEFSVHATWATVGFLFAHSREELEHFSPSLRPRYCDPRLDPYSEHIGQSESDDPFHFAPGLIGAIAVHPGQEIATHSFSHYYCCEPGQDAEAFRADLNSALAIARYSGHHIQSYVFPRNQVNPDYLPILKHAGFSAYRGTQASAVNAAAAFRIQRRIDRRALRLCDNYIDLYGPETISWPDTPNPRCVGASRYLRPCSQLLNGLETLRYRRIADAMQIAADRGQLFHLWWHPEDFALDCDANLRFLRRILVGYDRCRRESGMLSLSMSEAAGAFHESAPVPANAMKETI